MIDYNYQSSLFDDCSTHCEAYAACGGRKKTAPCGCAFPHGHELRHKCDLCYIACRERSSSRFLTTGQFDDFASVINSGLDIQQLIFKQQKITLPRFIPLGTQKYKGSKLFKDIVAIDVRSLFNCRQRKAATIKPFLNTEEDVRQYFKLDSSCRLMVVFNGFDRLLESIWAMDRRKMFEKLQVLGFSICTGPTFSQTGLTPDGMLIPYSHHIAMLMRHHRFLSESSNLGICSIPNFYWLDGDKSRITDWSNWLKANPDVSVISKEFTSTRHWPTIKQRVLELVKILKENSRYFHVVIVGTGPSNARKIVDLLSSEGYGVSVVTSAPIMTAIHGSKFFVSKEGRLSSSSSDRTEKLFSTLIEHNVKLFSENLEH